MTLKEISNNLSKRVLSSSELACEALDKAENDAFGCFITVADRDDALNAAMASDKRIKSGSRLSPLDGIPITVKDNILVSGMKMTCGSRILEDFTAPYDASAVNRLKDAGCIIIGKTNMDEFGMGSSTEYSAFHSTFNPICIDRVPGGSSGGAAASVASGIVPAALGSDTGGSVRQPASYCGVCGYKPTYGAVSRFGLTAFASSLDVIGVISEDPDGCAAVFDIISGRDVYDSTSHDLPENADLPMSFAVADELYNAASEKQRRAVDEAAALLSDMGWKRVSVSIPSIKYAVQAYYLISSAEASSNLARFDGIRYGRRTDRECESVEELISFSREEGLGKEVKRRILLGTYALSSGQREDWYQKAMTARRQITDDFKSAFTKCGIIIAPSVPDDPPKAGVVHDSPLEIYRSDIMTVPASLAGIPSISIPFENKGSLPSGVQIMASADSDRELLSLAQKMYMMRKASE